jgi:hypothetical protein
MNPKESGLAASVFYVAAPVSNGGGAEERAPPPPSLLRWLDHWFRTTSEERMRSRYMAYWS